MSDTSGHQSSREALISRAIEIFRFRPNGDKETCLQDICHFHDELVSAVSKNDRDEITAKGSLALSTLRIRPQVSEDLKRRIVMEADLCRCLQITCLHILHAIPTTMGPDIQSKKAKLETTLRQTILLLQILGNLQSVYLSKDCRETSTLPTNNSVLGVLLSQKTQLVEVDDNNNVITFDKEQLAMEEDELLQMALTPTPQEKRNAQQEDPTEDAPLTARLEVSEGESICVEFDGHGVLRSKDISVSGEFWWCITAASTTRYESPHFFITSVFCKRERDLGGEQSIKLIVGRDGPKWWAAVSTIIHHLRQAKELQEEVRKLWPEEQYNGKLEAGRKGITLESTTLNYSILWSPCSGYLYQ